MTSIAIANVIFLILSLFLADFHSYCKCYFLNFVSGFSYVLVDPYLQKGLSNFYVSFREKLLQTIYVFLTVSKAVANYLD